MRGILRRSAIGLAAVAMGAVSFAAPASAEADLGPCAQMTLMKRSGHTIFVPTFKGSSLCQLGRAYPAPVKVVYLFQEGLKTCYGHLNLASPYSDEKIANLDVDGSFGPRTEAALKSVQRNAGADVDGIYGPNTRDHIRFRSSDTRNCYAY
ncbi:MAG: peptidoglycan-binding protein [Saccharothrix sp.]|nr:peptidoglycan-binding protein [Saccharothrix sp.]